MAFPTTGAGGLDSYDRADGAVGSNWSADPENVLSGTGQPQVVSNRCQPLATGNSDGSRAWWNPATYGPDCECWVDSVSMASNGSTLQLYARGQQPDSNAFTWDSYMVALDRTAGGAFNMRVNRQDNSSATQLGATATDIGTPTKVGLDCVGSAITGRYYIAGWNAVARTDSTYSSTGYVAVTFYEPTSTANISIDGFSGGTTIVLTISNAVPANANAAATAATDIMAPDVTLTGQIAQALIPAPIVELVSNVPVAEAQASASAPWPVSYALPGTATAEGISLPGQAVPCVASAYGIVPTTNGAAAAPPGAAQASLTIPTASLSYLISYAGSARAEALVATSVAPFHWSYGGGTTFSYVGSTVVPPPGADTFTYGY